MPELPRMTAKEAEKLLLQNDFSIDRQKGSHRIYKKGLYRMVIPHH
ncbi:addiction module toxin, HicA family, partial [Campylobacter jejuni]|nr:addiction module toxin, HicA family [Campylobacter jejuni]